MGKVVPTPWVRQRHARGCAVAALAMLTRISYDEALRRLTPRRTPGGRLDITTSDILHAIRGMGHHPFAYGVVRHFSFARLRSRAIVLCDGDGDDPDWHAVMWEPHHSRVLDPAGRRARSRSFYERTSAMIILLCPLQDRLPVRATCIRCDRRADGHSWQSRRVAACFSIPAPKASFPLCHDCKRMLRFMSHWMGL